MLNRTYRYMEDEPLYPFGFGLSYGLFGYSEPMVSAYNLSESDTITISLDVENFGEIASGEVVQLYLSAPKELPDQPHYSLRKFKRVELLAGESASCEFQLSADDFITYDESGKQQLVKGEYIIRIGNASPSERSKDLGAVLLPEITINLRP